MRGNRVADVLGWSARPLGIRRRVPGWAALRRSDRGAGVGAKPRPPGRQLTF
jgi:hypothetical protein